MGSTRRFADLVSISTTIARSRLHTAVWLCGVTTAACVDSEPEYGETASASTVQDYVGSGCSTAVVIGLSKQIAQEADCLHPGSFVPFTSGNGITITSNAVLPFLEKSARDDLLKVAANNSLQINSALRTLAQQYLLYEWYQQGRCGITAAATVGNSNHEGGRAVDVNNYSTRISAMSAHGWAHDVPGDDVHFDHTSSPDGRGQDVLAFQRLWNRNHPGDAIGEDGAYGPQTEARLKQSPATGFAMGAICQDGTDKATVESVDGPDRVGSGQRAHYTITLKNTGTADWPATTKLVVASGQASQLYDQQTWTSPTVIGTISAVKAGAETTIQLDVQAPTVTADTPIDEPLELADGSTKFGSIDLALTVAMDGGGTSSDGGDTKDGGGCSAGSPGAGALLLVALAFVRRRRLVAVVQ
jgi:uncharacterized protein (TIGR03382 family)